MRREVRGIGWIVGLALVASSQARGGGTPTPKRKLPALRTGDREPNLLLRLRGGSSSAQGSYVVGVDHGTESVRAAVFDHEGRMISSSSSAYVTSFPEPGHAEQNPEDWWSCMCEAVQGALATAAEAGVSADMIKAMSVDTTSCTVVALDADGNPLR